LKGRNAGLPECVTEAWLIVAVEPWGTVAAGEGYMLARRWALGKDNVTFVYGIYDVFFFFFGKITFCWFFQFGW
jgi:hypothetical protein